MAFALAGSAAAQQPSQGKMIEQVKKRGKLQVGMASFVPWAMRDKQGAWIGFEIDVAKKLAGDLGVELELMPTAWDAIIPSLNASKFDVIIGGLSITPARQESVEFTAPYSQSGVGVTASKKLAANLKWPDDYNKSDITFTCKRGIAACNEVQKQFPKATLRQFDDAAIAFQEVINGNAHASVSSEPAPTFVTLQNPNQLFQPTKDYLLVGREGMALRKGDPDSIAFLNAWIAKANDSGWLKERHSYWFRGRDWAEQVAQ
ncbi:MAG: amino acid ABC transporter substrate-binding protein [Rhizobiales bacterium 65-9]|nr:MAG: amino acid ABC transporter substrate-binding protein [Rhizobiales bacterium 65-9]